MLSIVILAHDRPDLTRAALDSLCAAPMPAPWQLILVDNGSEHPFAPHLQDYRNRMPRITLLCNESNVSFAKANNDAGVQCEGEWLLFMNNDVCLLENTIAALISALERHPDAGVVGGKLLYPGSRRVQHAGLAQMLWGYASNYGAGGRAEDPRLCEEREVFAVTGAMLCVERKLFQKAGGFDESFWYGYEDVDLCLKIRSMGRKILYAPEMAAVHHESATLKQTRDETTFMKNYRHYRRKWNSILEAGERNLIRQMHQSAVKRVLVFGTGLAARGLLDILEANHISVVGCTQSPDRKQEKEWFGRPVFPLNEIDAVSFDRLVVGTQYYFEIEETLHRYVPGWKIMFPVVDSIVVENGIGEPGMLS
jgi:GT2 family glycosyltransferase